MADIPPHRFGRYELVGLIGRGGMGEVWHGRMEGAAGWKKDVAIKRLLPHLAQDAEFLSRFLDEGRLAASLSHGNIAAIFDMGEVDGEHFVAMEYVDGIDLRDALRLQRESGRPMPVEVAVLVASELCKALEYAHSRCDSEGHPLHIVHRDVSPSNVLLSRAGEVKLVDFGIAAARSRAVRTLTGQLRGKLSYMSPEQAAGGRVDARSDVFALGAVLYEMLSGQRALDGASEPEILARVQSADFVPLDRVRPGLDAELVAIVHRAMARHPDDRFASADAFGVELLRFLMRDTGPVTQRRLAAWVAELVPVRTPASVPVPRRNAFDALLDAQRLPAPDADATRTASGPVPAPQQSWPGAGAASGSFPGSSIPQAASLPPPPERRRPLGGLLALVAVLVALASAAAVFASRPATVALQVDSQPAEARVYVDGVELGTTPLRTRIDADAAQVRVALDGYRSESSVVAAVDGEMVWDVALHPLPVPVVFESIPPGATVLLGDGPAFVAGNAAPIEPNASVRVRMELDGFAPFDEVVTLQAGIDRYTARLEPLPATPEPATTDAAPTPDNEVRDEPPVTDSERIALTSRGLEPDRDAGPRVADAASSANVAAPMPPAPAAPPGEVLLWFPEPPMVGTLYVNGTAVSGHDWQHPLQLPPGNHTVEVVNTAYNVAHRAEIVVESGGTTRHMVSWQPR